MDIGRGELGPLSSGKLSAGRTFTASDANAHVALVDASYATQHKLTTGSTIAVGNKSGKATNFKVVGIVSEPAGDNPSDVYIPLAVAQNLAGLKDQVNTIYVAASSSSAISSVQSEIAKALPGYTVTTSSDLASEVTGSLSSASSLANNLGKWLALAVLIAAFLLASLLTMAAVSRRVREFGTLKAIGWKSRRIIGQVMGEAVTLGLIGGAIGVALGLAGAELVSKMSPKLSAVVGQTTGSATPGGSRQFGFGGAGGAGGGGFGGAGGGGGGGGGGGFGGGPGAGIFRPAGSAGHTVAVHLSAAVSANVILLAVVLAVAGGLSPGSSAAGGPRGCVPPPPWPRSPDRQEGKVDVQALRSDQELRQGPRDRGRAARGRPGDRGRRMAGHPGPDRARQVDAAADPRRPGPPVRRHRRLRRP